MMQEATGASNEVLLSNANRLLAAVGIVSKEIISPEELARVASSMFVAVLESLFHRRIDGINRNPQKDVDYAENAQIAIDYISRRIQMDLKHISGKEIASGDLTSISNLINILLWITSITRFAFHFSLCKSHFSQIIVHLLFCGTAKKKILVRLRHQAILMKV
jgi:hypothetical protein